MPLLQKLDKYLASEILSLTFVITAGISSIMIMAKLPRYSNFLFSAPDTGTSFLMLLLFIFPIIVKYAIPMSLLLASAIVMMRMATDRELEAWLACGVSILRMSIVPFIFGIGVTLLAVLSALYFEPYSNRQFKLFQWIQTRNFVEALIKSNIREKSFIYDLLQSNSLKMSMYFNNVSSDKSKFSDVFIAYENKDQTYSYIISAESGSLKKTNQAGQPDYIFSLHQGEIYSYQLSRTPLKQLLVLYPKRFRYPNKHPIIFDPINYPNAIDWTVTTFKNADISLISAFKNKFKLDSNVNQKDDDLYPEQYWDMIQSIKNKTKNWEKDPILIDKYLFFFKQIAIPLGTLFLPVIGLCLGIFDPRRKQVGVYLGLGIVIFLLYASLSLVQQMAIKFWVPPQAILVIPPLLLGCIVSLLLTWRLRYPPSMGFWAFFKEEFLIFLLKRFSGQSSKKG